MTIYDWAVTNNMCFYGDKFELLRFTVKGEPITFPFLTSEDTVIKAKSEVIDFGILMFSSWSFKWHVKEIIEKARVMLSWIFKTNAYSIPSFSSTDIGVLFPVMAPC